MTTPVKKWPHLAEWARLDSIALARDGSKLLIECLDEVDNPLTLRRLARAIQNYRSIETALMAVGPKSTKETRNDERSI